MDNEIKNSFIDRMVEEVSASVGIKEPISYQKLLSLIRNDKIKNATKFIAMQFGLPIDINIIVVPDDYREQNSGNRFYSTGMTKSNSNDSESGGIIAQVSIPSNLPIYGSQSLDSFLIDVRISKQSTKNPLSFALIMAHEISHVFLYSIRHPQKDNEFFTDITAISQGFHDVFYNGRKVVDVDIEVNEKFSWFTGTTTTKTTTTHTTTYGYLNDNQFAFVSNKILYDLSINSKQKDKFLEVIKKNEKITAKYAAILLRFNNYFGLITKNLDTKISGKDGKTLTYLFQPGYIEKIDLVLDLYNSKLEDLKKLYKNNFYYSAKTTEKITNISNELLVLSSKTKENVKTLKRYVRIMKKYINYKKRVILYYNYLKTRASNL